MGEGPDDGVPVVDIIGGGGPAEDRQGAYGVSEMGILAYQPAGEQPGQTKPRSDDQCVDAA